MTRLALNAVMLYLAGAAAVAGATGPPTAGIVQSSTAAGLYAANCSSCHGPAGRGVATGGRPGVGDLVGEVPSLRNVGAGTVDLYLRSGLMPLRNARLEPWRSPVDLTEHQIRQLVSFVAAFGHGPPIPHPDPARGSLSSGYALFTENCAGCHQEAAEGGYVTGARVPALSGLSSVEIAEAVRSGPYVMPRFSPEAISDTQLNSIIRYLDYTQHPADPGGWSIGRIGPVPEGMIAWLIAIPLLLSCCVVLSRRARHD